MTYSLKSPFSRTAKFKRVKRKTFYTLPRHDLLPTVALVHQEI